MLDFVTADRRRSTDTHYPAITGDIAENDLNGAAHLVWPFGGWAGGERLEAASALTRQQLRQRPLQFLYARGACRDFDR
jgi:hypothetical protein